MADINRESGDNDADPAWTVQGEQERDHLETLVAPWLIAHIEHVGSTAIPDLPGLTQRVRWRPSSKTLLARCPSTPAGCRPTVAPRRCCTIGFGPAATAVNVHGTLHGMKAVLPGMLARERGHIVNLSSTLGKIACPGGMSYCASKHAVVGISEAARQELRSSPVGLSLIMPGIANTDLASGVTTTRGIKRAEPDEIAAAIVDAVRTRRFEVFVPRSLGTISTLMAVLPRPLRELTLRLLGADRMLLDVDDTARHEYQERTIPASPTRK